MSVHRAAREVSNYREQSSALLVPGAGSLSSRSGLILNLFMGSQHNNPVIKSDQQCLSKRIWSCCLNWWFPRLVPRRDPASKWPHLPPLKSAMIKGRDVFLSTQQKSLESRVQATQLIKMPWSSLLLHIG